jgi:hypothetical protein
MNYPHLELRLFGFFCKQPKKEYPKKEYLLGMQLESWSNSNEEGIFSLIFDDTCLPARTARFPLHQELHHCKRCQHHISSTATSFLLPQPLVYPNIPNNYVELN